MGGKEIDFECGHALEYELKVAVACLDELQIQYYQRCGLKYAGACLADELMNVAVACLDELQIQYYQWCGFNLVQRNDGLVLKHEKLKCEKLACLDEHCMDSFQ